MELVKNTNMVVLEDENKKIITQFKNIPLPFKEMEWKVNLVYSSLLSIIYPLIVLSKLSKSNPSDIYHSL